MNGFITRTFITIVNYFFLNVSELSCYNASRAMSLIPKTASKKKNFFSIFRKVWERSKKTFHLTMNDDTTPVGWLYAEIWILCTSTNSNLLSTALIAPRIWLKRLWNLGRIDFVPMYDHRDRQANVMVGHHYRPTDVAKESVKLLMSQSCNLKFSSWPNPGFDLMHTPIFSVTACIIFVTEKSKNLTQYLQFL